MQATPAPAAAAATVAALTKTNCMTNAQAKRDEEGEEERANVWFCVLLLRITHMIVVRIAC